MIAIFAGMIASCDKEDDAAVGMTISGTLEFNEKYDNDEITKVQIAIREPVTDNGITLFKNVVLASGAYSDGIFSLELPAMVDDKYLGAHLLDEDFPPSIKVSNKNVKTGVFSISTSNFDDTKQIPTTGGLVSVLTSKVYPLVYVKKDDKSITEAILLYADRKCSITGSMTMSDETITYSVHLKRGWNILYETRPEYMESADKQIRREECTTNPISGLKWYVHWDFYK
jgi:hypothetical protein